MPKKVDINRIMQILEGQYPPIMMAEIYMGQPYKALVSCILSLRNRDEITFPIAEKLFAVADNPHDIATMPYERLCEIIKSINYYRTKAENIQLLSRQLIDEYNGEVPESFDELLKFRGVGRKTANLVISVGFEKDAIVVDTHVHRVSNRLGYVHTKTPEETEYELVKKLPRKYWRKINRTFILHGKNTCKPITPLCDICPIIDFCNQVGVVKKYSNK